MSADDPTQAAAEPLTLARYITALIDTLGAHHLAALSRMRLVVGALRARIALDEESCVAYFTEDGLVVQPVEETTVVDGEGSTDSGTVIALLDGDLEVTEAILDGRLLATGKAEDIVKMFTAIEILLDAAPRTPALQLLAQRFRRERVGTSFFTRPNRATSSDTRAAEHALLKRLGLLPETS